MRKDIREGVRDKPRQVVNESIKEKYGIGHQDCPEVWRGVWGGTWEKVWGRMDAKRHEN